MSDATLRQALLDTSRQLLESGLNRGTAGNASVRCGDGFLITPSALPVSAMMPDSMVSMTLAGEVVGNGKPSSEWRFHRDILAARPEINAVVHCHSMFATTLACLHLEVPAVHYMIEAAGGDTVRCAPYALFGTQTLSDFALDALRDRRACLLGNHGQIAAGKDLTDALAVAIEVEFLCELYWRTLQAGEPHLLSGQQMREVKQRFIEYKQPGTH